MSSKEFMKMSFFVVIGNGLKKNTHRHLWFQLQVLICINDSIVLKRVLLLSLNVIT